jgi:hypothetical protein
MPLDGVIPLQASLPVLAEYEGIPPPVECCAESGHKPYSTVHALGAKTMPAGANVARITTQKWPGMKGMNLTAATGLEKLYAGQAGAEASQEPAGPTLHVQHYVTRKITREGAGKSKLRGSHLQTQ